MAKATQNAEIQYSHQTVKAIPDAEIQYSHQTAKAIHTLKILRFKKILPIQLNRLNQIIIILLTRRKHIKPHHYQIIFIHPKNISQYQ